MICTKKWHQRVRNLQFLNNFRVQKQSIRGFWRPELDREQSARAWGSQKTATERAMARKRLNADLAMARQLRAATVPYLKSRCKPPNYGQYGDSYEVRAFHLGSQLLWSELPKMRSHVLGA